MAVTIAPAELNHIRATANLSVEGLAMTHFDAARRIWEINFLRNTDHTLTLVVSGNGVFREIPIDRTVQSISVSAVRGIMPDFEQFPNGYWFSNQFFLRRIDQGHPEDFRWVPDLANRFEFLLHAQVRPRDAISSSTIDSVTELTIPNVIFYTRQRTWYPLTQAIGPLVDPFALGKTNTMIGADIFCEDGGAVVIEIGGERWELPHVPGSPYQIEFENSDSKRFPVPPDQLIQGEFIKGDFALYYEFLDVAGAHYDMLCPAEVYRSSDCDCNPSFVSHFD